MLNFANEYIFHTVQGEGKYAGYPTVFVRLSGCNLRCAWKNPDQSITQCDTPHTSFAPEKNQRTVAETVEKILAIDCEHVVITGGEPFLQQIGLMTELLWHAGRVITIETNGTIYKPNKAQFMSISPKLKSSSADEVYGMSHDSKRINYKVLDQMLRFHDCQLKFVANTESEVDEIKDIVNKLESLYGHHNVNDKVYLMPQGITHEQFDERAKWIFEVCKKNNWKYTDRLHVRIYGNLKGV